MGISLLEGSSRGVAVLCTTNTSTAFCTLHLKGNEAHKGPSSQLGFPAQDRSPLHHGEDVRPRRGCQTSKITMSSGSPQLRLRGGALTQRQIGHQGVWGFKVTKTARCSHSTAPGPYLAFHQDSILSIAHVKLYYKPLTGHYFLNSPVAPGPSPSLQPDRFPSLYSPSMFQQAAFQFDSSNFDSYL